VGGIVLVLLGAATPAPCAEAALRRLPSGSSLTFQDEAWLLELRAPGRIPLRRTLRLPPGDCALLEDTAGLIADRYLRALTQPRPRPRAPVAIAQAAQTDAVRAPLVVETLAVPSLPAPRIELAPERAVLIPELDAAADLPPEPDRRWTVALSAGASGSLSGDDVRPGLWLDLTARSPRWALSISLAGATGAADLVERRGTTDGMSLDSGLLALSAKPCVDLWVRACAGPYLGARVIAGESPRVSYVALQGEAGAALQIDRAFLNGFHFSATLLVGATAGPLSNEALETAGSRFDVTAALTLGYQLF
jgi:hypothetical protein